MIRIFNFKKIKHAPHVRSTFARSPENTLNNNETPDSGIFIYFLFLTGFFFLLEISFFIQCMRTYLSDFSFVTGYVHIPMTILPGIFYFIFAEIFVHFLYCIFIWIITLSIVKVLPQLYKHKMSLGVVIWSLGVLTILTANQYFFPNSKFAELTQLILITKGITQSILIFTAISWILISFLSFIGFIKLLFEKSLFLPLLIGLIGVAGISFFPYLFSNKNKIVLSEQPNIILVGVDSLRPDFLSFFGHEKETRFFDSFLNQSTVFTEAVTPLARTFPSWSSILMGKYPREIKIRTNLSSQKQKSFKDSLPFILKENGYETIFATDETRFSNIDTNFGFDRIITPPIGVNDFLLGTFNDFPLSNLLINTVIGKWLFPYSYGNRPAYFTYDPDSFLNLLHPIFLESRQKPLFLAVHFCLPHYPYLWASLPGKDYSIRERYEASIIRADKQIGDFFFQLKKNHLLDHAVVVLLSDHGEALEFSGDRITENELFLKTNPQQKVPHFYPPSQDEEEINQSAGHGGDVLGLPQYHTLLAFQLYGMGEQIKTMVPGIVSLTSIKSTLMQILQIPNVTTHSPSLLDVIKGKGKIAPEHIFLESDFSPEAIRTVYPETRKVVLEGIHLFEIDPKTTRLTVKPSTDEMNIKSKQYADIYGEWMLALYPQSAKNRMPILINLVNGYWTNDLNSPFAKQSPASLMLEKLKFFYGDEI